jgi:hypothetical protein
VVISWYIAKNHHEQAIRLSQNPLDEAIKKLRRDLAGDRQKIAEETDHVCRQIEAERPPAPQAPVIDDPDYIKTALAAERLLGQMAERLRDRARHAHVSLASSLIESCDAVTAEGRGATPRRLLQFTAHGGETSAHFENLSGAMDVFETLQSRHNSSQRSFTAELITQVATRSSIRSRNWLEPGDIPQWRTIIADRQVPCPVAEDMIEGLYSRILNIPANSGLIGAADALYIVLTVMSSARLGSLDLSITTAEQNLHVEVDDPQAAYWNRICRIIISDIIGHFCQGIHVPIISGVALTQRMPKLTELLHKHPPARMARPLTIGILADGIEKLAHIDQQMKQVWDRAALLANEGRGTSLEKINKRLFQTGSICVSDIVRECDITPQAAHYQIKRLLKAGILSRGPRGRAGGHYFLDVLLQI